MAKFTVSNYPRDNLSAKTRSMLDALAANPATANVGVRSGYRDPEHNAKVGGAKKSQHIHGNAVDLDISGFTDAQKKEVLDTAAKAGAKGIGIYNSGNVLHIDPRQNPLVWGPSPRGKYRGLLTKEWGLIPEWARPTVDAIFGGINPQPNPNLPETMQAPKTLSQVRAQESVAQAFRDPMRALDVVPSALSPSRLASQYGQYRPGTVPAPALPSVNAVRPSVPGSMPAARPAPAVNAVRPSVTGSLPAARPSTPATQAVRPALSVGSLPAARQQTTVATRPETPAPTGLPAAAPSTADLAAQYGQYRTPTTYTNVRNAMLAQPVAQPVAPPVTPPALAVPPAPVLAPLLAPPTPVKNYPVAEVQAPPVAPRATAYDVYSGLADTALDNTGRNTVSAMPGGGTSVTNQYGATTGMKNGYQTAVGSLPGISGPTASRFGSAVKGAIPGVAGSALGGLLGGPVGALIGAALAKAVTQPGGILSGQNSFQTNAFGTINTNKPQSGLGFPGAPSGGYGSGGKMGASFSNNSANGMRSISPAAADAIGRGVGGLY